MRKIQHYFMLLVLCSFLMACGSGKEQNNEESTDSEQDDTSKEDNNEETEEEANNSGEDEETEDDPMKFFYGPWKVVKLTCSDEDSDLGLSMDLETQRNSTYFFDIEGSYNMTSNPDFDTPDKGNWEMSEDRKILTLKDRESGLPNLVFKIEKFTAETIEANFDYPYAGKKYPSKIVFEAQAMD